jgi:hypothetical protein
MKKHEKGEKDEKRKEKDERSAENGKRRRENDKRNWSLAMIRGDTSNFNLRRTENFCRILTWLLALCFFVPCTLHRCTFVYVWPPFRALICH